ncbi:MAG: prolipoprotein diacylglyceryl transferase [Candidatus Brocadiia bacterium]|nr:prolipoprotein diacylglyceryl transferase [Candidatus Brocadiia bacterium]
MHPTLLKIPLPWGGHFSIPAYGFLIMCGFLVALAVARRRGRRLGINPDHIMDAALASLLGGIIGSRLFYVIFFAPEIVWDNPLRIFAIWEGGLVFYGGVIGGGVALFLTMARKGLPVRRTLDVILSAVPLAHAFGRLGCFMNGCCFGKVTELWLGIRFPRILEPGSGENGFYEVGAEHITGSPPFVHHLSQSLVAKLDAWSQPIHPTQLYAVGYNLLVFGCLALVFYRRRRAGEVAWLYAILYGTARFLNEFMRGDQEPVLLGVTIAQVICIPLAAFGLAALLRGRSLPREPLPEPWEPSDTQEPDEVSHAPEEGDSREPSQPASAGAGPRGHRRRRRR